MAAFVSTSSLKDALTECPVCRQHFNDTRRLPRRMPCCVQSICHQCLTRIYARYGFACPMCRHNHVIPAGVQSFPVESLILKLLDHLKIQKGLALPCTNCPDSNNAICRCDECSIFLCGECKNAHARLITSRNHETLTLEEMRDRPVTCFRRRHQCSQHQQPLEFYCNKCTKVICVSCTVVEHKTGPHKVVSINDAHLAMAAEIEKVLKELDSKVQSLSQITAKQKTIQDNIQKSKRIAKNGINARFDTLIEDLQQRRHVLLSDVDARSEQQLRLTEEALDASSTLLTRVRSAAEYTRKMRGKADKVEDLGMMSTTTGTLKDMLEESTQDVEFARAGVGFVPAHDTQLTSIIRTAGMVRSVTFTPAEKPSYVPEIWHYNRIYAAPAELPAVEGLDVVTLSQTRPDMKQTCSPGDQILLLNGKDGAVTVTCPHLEFDPATVSDDVTMTGESIINIRPGQAPPDTGCRIQGGRHVLVSRPLVISRGHRAMFLVKTKFTLKKVIPDDMIICEAAVTSSPVDANSAQHTGLSVVVVSCRTHHHQLCLWVKYEGELLADVPVTQNQVGASRDLHLCVLLDGDKNKIHVVDVDDVTVVASVSCTVSDRPRWLMMYVDVSTTSDMTSELVSGSKITPTPQLLDTLSHLV